MATASVGAAAAVSAPGSSPQPPLTRPPLPAFATGCNLQSMRLHLDRLNLNDSILNTMGCTERFVARTMMDFPPPPLLVRRQERCCCSNSNSNSNNNSNSNDSSCNSNQKQSQSNCMLRRMSKAVGKCVSFAGTAQMHREDPGLLQFERLLRKNRKRERLLVPDLATEWFRKQKVCLDSITEEEIQELECSKHLRTDIDFRPALSLTSNFPCPQYCRCNDGRTNLSRSPSAEQRTGLRNEQKVLQEPKNDKQKAGDQSKSGEKPVRKVRIKGVDDVTLICRCNEPAPSEEQPEKEANKSEGRRPTQWNTKYSESEEDVTKNLRRPPSSSNLRSRQRSAMSLNVKKGDRKKSLVICPKNVASCQTNSPPLRRPGGRDIEQQSSVTFDQSGPRYSTRQRSIPDLSRTQSNMPRASRPCQPCPQRLSYSPKAPRPTKPITQWTKETMPPCPPKPKPRPTPESKFLVRNRVNKWGCVCMQPPTEADCLLFQGDGQPMAEECIPRPPEPSAPRLRRMYDIRKAPQRNIDPSRFRRISPEFYCLLKSYEDEMTERYPLYGIPMRYWVDTQPCCPCEIYRRRKDDRCLGDEAATHLPHSLQTKPKTKSGLPEMVMRMRKKQRALEPDEKNGDGDNDKETETEKKVDFCDRKSCNVLADSENGGSCTEGQCRRKHVMTTSGCYHCKTGGPAAKSDQKPIETNYRKQPDKKQSCAIFRRRDKQKKVRSDPASERSSASDGDTTKKPRKNSSMLRCFKRKHSQILPVEPLKGGGLPPNKVLPAGRIIASGKTTPTGKQPLSKAKNQRKSSSSNGIMGGFRCLCKKALKPGRYLLYNFSNIKTNHQQHVQSYAERNNLPAPSSSQFLAQRSLFGLPQFHTQPAPCKWGAFAARSTQSSDTLRPSSCGSGCDNPYDPYNDTQKKSNKKLNYKNSQSAQSDTKSSSGEGGTCTSGGGGTCSRGGGKSKSGEESTCTSGGGGTCKGKAGGTCKSGGCGATKKGGGGTCTSEGGGTCTSGTGGTCTSGGEGTCSGGTRRKRSRSRCSLRSFFHLNTQPPRNQWPADGKGQDCRTATSSETLRPSNSAAGSSCSWKCRRGKALAPGWDGPLEGCKGCGLCAQWACGPIGHVEEGVCGKPFQPTTKSSKLAQQKQQRSIFKGSEGNTNQGEQREGRDKYERRERHESKQTRGRLLNEAARGLKMAALLQRPAKFPCRRACMPATEYNAFIRQIARRRANTNLPMRKLSATKLKTDPEPIVQADDVQSQPNEGAAVRIAENDAPREPILTPSSSRAIIPNRPIQTSNNTSRAAPTKIRTTSQAPTDRCAIIRRQNQNQLTVISNRVARPRTRNPRADTVTVHISTVGKRPNTSILIKKRSMGSSAATPLRFHTPSTSSKTLGSTNSLTYKRSQGSNLSARTSGTLHISYSRTSVQQPPLRYRFRAPKFAAKATKKPPKTFRTRRGSRNSTVSNQRPMESPYGYSEPQTPTICTPSSTCAGKVTRVEQHCKVSTVTSPAISEVCSQASKTLSEPGSKMSGESRQSFSDARASDTRALDARASDTRASDARASNARASNARASDARASDARASNARASNARASNARSSDARASNARASDARASDARSSDARAAAVSKAACPCAEQVCCKPQTQRLLETGRRYYTDTQPKSLEEKATLGIRYSSRSLHSNHSIPALCSNTNSVTCPCVPAPSAATVATAATLDTVQRDTERFGVISCYTSGQSVAQRPLQMRSQSPCILPKIFSTQPPIIEAYREMREAQLKKAKPKVPRKPHQHARPEYSFRTRRPTPRQYLKDFDYYGWQQSLCNGSFQQQRPQQESSCQCSWVYERKPRCSQPDSIRTETDYPSCRTSTTNAIGTAECADKLSRALGCCAVLIQRQQQQHQLQTPCTTSDQSARTASSRSCCSQNENRNVQPRRSYCEDKYSESEAMGATNLLSRCNQLNSACRSRSGCDMFFNRSSSESVDNVKNQATNRDGRQPTASSLKKKSSIDMKCQADAQSTTSASSSSSDCSSSSSGEGRGLNSGSSSDRLSKQRKHGTDRQGGRHSSCSSREKTKEATREDLEERAYSAYLNQLQGPKLTEQKVRSQHRSSGPLFGISRLISRGYGNLARRRLRRSASQSTRVFDPPNGDDNNIKDDAHYVQEYQQHSHSMQQPQPQRFLPNKQAAMQSYSDFSTSTIMPTSVSTMSTKFPTHRTATPVSTITNVSGMSRPPSQNISAAKRSLAAALVANSARALAEKLRAKAQPFMFAPTSHAPIALKSIRRIDIPNGNRFSTDVASTYSTKPMRHNNFPISLRDTFRKHSKSSMSNANSGNIGTNNTEGDSASAAQPRIPSDCRKPNCKHVASFDSSSTPSTGTNSLLSYLSSSLERSALSSEQTSSFILPTSTAGSMSGIYSTDVNSAFQDSSASALQSRPSRDHSANDVEPQWNSSTYRKKSTDPTPPHSSTIYYQNTTRSPGCQHTRSLSNSPTFIKLQAAPRRVPPPVSLRSELDFQTHSLPTKSSTPVISFHYKKPTYSRDTGGNVRATPSLTLLDHLRKQMQVTSTFSEKSTTTSKLKSQNQRASCERHPPMHPMSLEELDRLNNNARLSRVLHALANGSTTTPLVIPPTFNVPPNCNLRSMLAKNIRRSS